MHRTRIKICGITRPGDAVEAARAGADAIGLVFYPPSPRAVGLRQALDIVRELPPLVGVVALFVRAEPQRVREVIDALRPSLLQFHGDESAEDCEAFGHPYLRAVRMRTGVDLLDSRVRHAHARGLLLDAFVEGFGGGGEVFDWSLIPTNVGSPIVLSGGLRAANVAQAILRVRPWAVDVSSGVESAKGVKDAAAMREFVAAVRAADAAAQQADKAPPAGR
jgi:phosphoribosylanthranilate isomerase